LQQFKESKYRLNKKNKKTMMKGMKRIVRVAIQNRVQALLVTFVSIFLFTVSFVSDFDFASNDELRSGRVASINNDVRGLQQQTSYLVEHQFDQLSIGFREEPTQVSNISNWQGGPGSSISVLMIESRCDARVGAVLENVARLLPSSHLMLVHSRDNADYVHRLSPVIFNVSVIDNF